MNKNIKTANPMKVITGPDTRWSYANVLEPKSINGGTPKYSVSLIIPKSDTKTVAKIVAAVEAAYKEGEGKLKGSGKSVPALSVLKTPLRDGDLERPDDPTYANAYFVNANATSAPGIVDVDRNPILTRSEVYSGVYGRASSTPLQKLGVYRYVEAPNFEILLFGYSVDAGLVQVIDLVCGEHIPKEILAALEDAAVTKWAFINACFKRICLSRFLGYLTGDYLDPESWRCSMIRAATMGLPLSLEGVSAVLDLEKQKLTVGKDLIKYFFLPCAPTKVNGERTRNRSFHAPKKMGRILFPKG